MATQPRGLILLIEDDNLIRRVVGECLRDDEYQVVEAKNGAEALAVLEHTTPNVIVLDLMMPEMDGWAFREKQQEQALRLDVPLIILSASRRRVDAASTLDAAAVIAKPFEIDDLLELVERVLAREESVYANTRGEPPTPTL